MALGEPPAEVTGSQTRSTHTVSTVAAAAAAARGVLSAFIVSGVARHGRWW